MAITVTHTTPADGTFSAEGAAAWDADHALSGLGTMAEQNANNVAITGGTISGVAVTGYVPTTETITAGTGLTGGGDLSANRTIALADTAVTTGTYGNASRTIMQTVDQQGRLTNIFDQPIAIANTQVTGLGTASTKDAGVASGVATLDASGKVPVSQIPLQGDLNYQGTWNATTNTPTLTSSVGTQGYYYVVDVAGTTNLNGTTDWQIGDWAIFNGTVWQKVDNTDAGGDVVGPASATDTAIARFDTTTGKLLQNSVITVSDVGDVAGITTLGAATSLTTPKVFLPIPGKIIFVSNISGDDTAGDGSFTAPYATIAKALAIAGGSGYQITLFPSSTPYDGNTITNQNLTICSVSQSGGALTSIAATTISNSASSIRLVNIGFPSGLTFTGSGRLYTQNCYGTNLVFTGSGYFNSFNDDFSDGTISITGNGLYTFSDGSLVGPVTVDNASAVATFTNTEIIYSLIVTAGVAALNNCVVTATTVGGYAASVASGGYLQATNTQFITTAAAAGIINFATGALYKFGNVFFTPTGSILNGTNLGGVSTFSALSLPLTGYLSGTGNGNAITASSTIPTSAISGVLVVSKGGTGQSTYTNGDLLIGNTTGNTLTKAKLTAGAGIAVTNGNGSISISNSSPDQTVTMTSGTGISVSGTYPNFTVTNTAPSSGGTVTSVTATAPVASTGGTTPVISMPAATTSVSGYLTSTDWNTFNGKQTVLVSGTNIKTVNGATLLGSGNLAVGTVTSVGGTGTVNGLTLSGTVTTSGNLTLGGTLDLSSPPAIGATAANTGAFTTLVATSGLGGGAF